MNECGVTGATGVLGRRIVSRLVQQGVRVDTFSGDVRNAQEVAHWARSSHATAIIHAAAMVPVADVEADPGTAAAVNISGAANLARAASTTGKRLVYVSSSHVYAPQKGALSERDVTTPPSLYGLSKLHGEQWALHLAADSVSVRLFSLFDPRQDSKFVVPSLVERIRNAPQNEVMELNGYHSVRDFASAAWLAEVVTALAGTQFRGIVNCATGVGTHIGGLARDLAQLSGRSDVRFVPAGSTADTMVADTALLESILPDLRRPDLQTELAGVVGGL